MPGGTTAGGATAGGPTASAGAMPDASGCPGAMADATIGGGAAACAGAMPDGTPGCAGAMAFDAPSWFRSKAVCDDAYDSGKSGAGDEGG